ncbi:MAG: 1,4-dihydroxy-6-naphthoate synthase [Phyllobacteriaceae bacterium]|nr:1,4-dihydroxy-6-naphthoate synthase [Phyllobacteriaceae bacterium]
MKLKVGFSPCPNDTFIFYALIHGLIETELEIEPVIADVEELNQKAFAGELEVTKLSYHALGHLLNKYALLDAGSALGNNCGPLLISKRHLEKSDVDEARIAIPGKYTTANFLLSLAFPSAKHKVEMLFSDIEDAVLNESVDAGLIIHENRFTYQSKGLRKIMDLGEYWESTTGLPIPLGGIAIRKDLPRDVQVEFNRILRESVLFARANPEATTHYIKKYAQEMDETVMHSHINLYVNDFTVSLGETGETAVKKLFSMAQEKGIIPTYTENFLIN